MFSIAAWDWATIANVAVALGTGLLAWATFRLATQAREQAAATRSQADHTADLVDIARRDLAATAEPAIRTVEPTAGGVSGDDLAVTIRNTGGVQAVIVGSHLRFHEYAEFGNVRGSPAVDPDRQATIDFSLPPREMLTGAPRRADAGQLTIRYEGAASGTKMLVVEIEWDGAQVHARAHRPVVSV
jgi:hypothetical protein